MIQHESRLKVADNTGARGTKSKHEQESGEDGDKESHEDNSGKIQLLIIGFGAGILKPSWFCRSGTAG